MADLEPKGRASPVETDAPLLLVCVGVGERGSRHSACKGQRTTLWGLFSPFHPSIDSWNPPQSCRPAGQVLLTEVITSHGCFFIWNSRTFTSFHRFCGTRTYLQSHWIYCQATPSVLKPKVPFLFVFLRPSLLCSPSWSPTPDQLPECTH